MQTGSKTYRDPNFSYDREIRALYISSLSLARSLIFDTWYGSTDYATVDFSTSKVTYKRCLPLMSKMLTGIFISETIYYVGSYDAYFYPG